MCLSKRLLSGAMIVILSIFQLVPLAGASEETSFIITAYYSPVKGQLKYLHGSYEREIYVNGEGTHGASGEAVFEGMLAAPKKYPFGTKIHFEGYGVAEVQDRGGAIVSAGSRGNSYDRIDIWMGYGDAGRERAIHWGKKTVKGKIVSSESENSISFASVPVTDGKTLLAEGEENFYGVTEISKEHSILLEYGNMQVDPDSPRTEIRELQKLLTELGEYNGEIDGYYSSIEKDLIALQKKLGVVQKDDDWGAGHYGNKTRSALWVHYDNNMPRETIVISEELSEPMEAEIIAEEVIEMKEEPLKEYRLTSSEELAIKKAISNIRKRLIRAEKQGGANAEKTLQNLSRQIDQVLPSIDDPVLRAKIILIQSEIS